MRYKLLLEDDDFEWLIDIFDEGTEEHKARFLRKAHKKMLDADTPLEVAQKVLQADSPVELALKAIQSEEQRRELLKRLQQASYQSVSKGTQEATLSA